MRVRSTRPNLQGFPIAVNETIAPPPSAGGRALPAGSARAGSSRPRFTRDRGPADLPVSSGLGYTLIRAV